MATYLVTGAAGFIANRVARDLAADHQVVAVDNVNDYYDVRLKEHRIEQLRGVEFHRLDIENRAALAELFARHRFDAVINLAARAGVRYSMVNPTVYMTTNAMGSLNLIDLMREHDVKKYVLASTSSLYAGQPMPFVESLPVNTPISPYAASKKVAEVMAYSYHFLYGLDVSIVRYFTVYGPAGRPDMSIFRFIKWIDRGEPIEIFGDGSQSRDFTYVDDIAAGTIAATRPVGYEIINLGGGNNPISINRVIEVLEGLLGKKARINHHPFHKADMVSTWADISKAKRLLDWEPKISLEEGLERCVRWYVDHLPWSSTLELGSE
ncbi:MAG TPA: nucleotide sugar epimerase [Planctomycetaceae bacterium]|nr:nucleotide sugar epimerase [Planctomycetaceae bacterium]HRF00714.1 NAD-dependent epimerase/dehydratase family protein [Pirellulaceae bacterium]